MVNIPVENLKVMYEDLANGDPATVRKEIRDILLKLGWSSTYIGEGEYKWVLKGE